MSRPTLSEVLREAERGVSKDGRAALHAPIGLDIGGDQPGELAVSILARMIRVRRSGSAAAKREIA